MAKLKLYEINAVTSKIIAILKEEIKIPDFKKEMKTAARVYKELEELNKIAWEEEEKLVTLAKKHNFSIYGAKNPNFFPSFNRDEYIKKESKMFLKKKLPLSRDIKDEVIVSGNSSLEDIIKTIVKKYK